MSGRRRNRWVVIFWVYIAILGSISLSAYLGLLPRNSGLLALPHADHVIHFLLLGGASFLSHRALGGRWLRFRRVGLPLGPLIVGLASITDECFQSLSPVRTFDLLDMASNVSGVIVFGALAEAMIRRAIRRSEPSAASPPRPTTTEDPGDRAAP